MSVKQISVFLENKPGTLMSMTDTLAAHNIDMRALSLAETSDFGIVRIIVDDVSVASTVLQQAGFISSISDVLGVRIPDEPGGLHKILQILSQTQANIEYMYAFLGGKDAEHAYMIFRVTDPAAAAAALAAQGIKTVEHEEMAQL